MKLDDIGMVEYSEAVELALASMPDCKFITEPSESLLRRLRETLAGALSVYQSQKTDLPLAGAYSFDASANDSTELADTCGICTHLDSSPELAIIGIASEVLLHPSENYRLLIALHELCHLSGVAHDEAFNLRFCHNLYRLFNEKPANMDSLEYRWRMRKF